MQIVQYICCLLRTDIYSHYCRSPYRVYTVLTSDASFVPEVTNFPHVPLHEVIIKLCTQLDGIQPVPLQSAQAGPVVNPPGGSGISSPSQDR